jgi:hypothetical protein
LFHHEVSSLGSQPFHLQHHHSSEIPKVGFPVEVEVEVSPTFQKAAALRLGGNANLGLTNKADSKNIPAQRRL